MSDENEEPSFLHAPLGRATRILAQGMRDALRKLVTPSPAASKAISDLLEGQRGRAEEIARHESFSASQFAREMNGAVVVGHTAEYAPEIHEHIPLNAAALENLAKSLDRAPKPPVMIFGKGQLAALEEAGRAELRHEAETAVLVTRTLRGKTVLLDDVREAMVCDVCGEASGIRWSDGNRWVRRHMRCEMHTPAKGKPSKDARGFIPKPKKGEGLPTLFGVPVYESGV